MKANLGNFPKYDDFAKHLPDHKHGVNTNTDDLAELGKAVIQWRSTFEQGLKDLLEQTRQTKKEDEENSFYEDEETTSYWQGHHVGTIDLLKEILGPELSRIVVPDKSKEPSQ